VLPQAPVVADVTALQGGTLSTVPARAIGELAGSLGAGRSRPGEDVDPAVGIEVLAEVGQSVSPGDLLARVHARTQDDAQRAVASLRSLLGWTDGDLDAPDVILERIGTV
jgi:thymidine phosphorylase